MKRLKICTVSALVVMAFSLTMVHAASNSGGRFIASNSMRVVGDASDPGRFDILQRAGNGGSDYWCAAGEYVIKGRGLNSSTRIYLVQPMGRGRLDRNSIGFTITPDASLNAGESTAPIMSMKRVGQSWSASFAWGQCPSDRRRNR